MVPPTSVCLPDAVHILPYFVRVCALQLGQLGAPLDLEEDFLAGTRYHLRGTHVRQASSTRQASRRGRPTLTLIGAFASTSGFGSGGFSLSDMVLGSLRAVL